MKKKIAVVHEFFHKIGGAERTLLEILKCLSGYDVELFFLNANEKLIQKYCAKYKVNVSKISSLGFLQKFNKIFAPFYPRLIEGFDLSQFDLIVCSSNSFAHGVISKTETPVICYYHSPCRYIWDWKNEYKQENKLSGFKGVVADWILHKQRVWDLVASRRPDVVLANSRNVQNRILKYYKRDSEILYPPVEVRNFDKSSLNWSNRGEYYLISCTLTPYKKIDLAIKAFNELGLKLIVTGSGSELSYLQSIARKNIEFRGFVDDIELSRLMAQARGFIFPGEEDFGIAPVEAMGHGCPVIALGKGGLRETVIENETGVFFDGSVSDLINVVRKYDQNFENFDPQDCHKQACNFDSKIFANKFKQIIDKYV